MTIRRSAYRRQFDTEYCADSVEFWRYSDDGGIIACGTYQVVANEKDSGYNRLGRLLLYQLSTLTDDEDNDDFASNRLQLTPVLSKDTPAILDLRWSPDQKGLLASAHADGTVGLWQIRPTYSNSNNDDNNLLHQLSKTSIATTATAEKRNNLILSLDWSQSSGSAGLLATSCSDGQLAVVDCSNESAALVSNSWTAHEFEAWVVACDRHDSNLLYSGGDDCWFKGWDRRQPEPIFQRRRSMGVTSVQSHPIKEYCLASGGYDEMLVLWDRRFMRSPLAEQHMGGGVWRIKWQPHHPESTDRKTDRILTACMHNGFHVVSVDWDGSEAYTDVTTAIEHTYDRHESLAYGVDWIQMAGRWRRQDHCWVVSCSFYDHALHLWQYIDSL